MSTTTRTPTTIARENWRAVALALVVVATAGSTLAIVAATPSTNVPIGVSSTSGVSMTPTYGTSGIALYADVGELEKGDVVVFHERKNTGAYTMHRVVGETEQGFVTQGDALGSTDQAMGRSYVTESTRVGEVWLVVDETGVHFPGF